MSLPESNETARTSLGKPLRVWPGVAAVVPQWLAWFVFPLLAPDLSIYGMLAGAVLGVVTIAWWLFFSRAAWLERIGAIVLMIVAVVATRPLVDESISDAGMGRLMYVYSLPLFGLAVVLWALAARGLRNGPRRAALVAAILLACGLFTVVRTGGITGDAKSDVHWRWTPTPEERLLAEAGREVQPTVAAPSAPAPAAPAAATPAPPTAAPAPAATPDKPIATPGPPPSAPAAAKTHEKTPVVAVAKAAPIWPGFRGPNRDSVIHGLQIETDWSKAAPVELWRRKIGPGWSSFAVDGNLIYTQEQRGDQEIVSCYNLATGAPVWMHGDAARFYESNGGPGPRATPTLHNGRVYTMGATGIVNALDAATGAVVWSRNAASDTGVENPGWGFAGSPLIVDDVVIVAASGRLAGYELATGKPRWLGPTGGAGYSSPHPVTVDGVAQVVLLRGSRTISVSPADGTLLWQHVWLPGVSIVQPGVTAEGDILITSGDAMGGQGVRRLAIAHAAGGWTAEERWTSRALKPYFNDFVVHDGHAYGFDGSILACIDLKDGTRKWKGGRYGNGQIILLPDEDLLLVSSEEGELALVKATPDAFTEVAKVPAIEGKTWNHPALAGDVLLMRNGEEMAAFRLPLARATDRN
jgi:outer membrane protein assembly factor BamB